MPRLTYRRLRQVLDYNALTGQFVWRVSGPNQYMQAGAIAGCPAPNGWKIGIDGYRYLASRLAVLWMTGQWPLHLVDHKNRDVCDNRWSNLRQATSSQNLHNMRMKDNSLGFKGVVFCKLTGRYRARIRVNYRNIHLGRFDTPQEAHAAYIAAAKKYFGEFARAK